MSVRTFVVPFYYGSGSDFLACYGSGSASQKGTVPTVPVPQRWQKAFNHTCKHAKTGKQDGPCTLVAHAAGTAPSTSISLPEGELWLLLWWPTLHCCRGWDPPCSLHYTCTTKQLISLSCYRGGKLYPGNGKQFVNCLCNRELWIPECPFT